MPANTISSVMLKRRCVSDAPTTSSSVRGGETGSAGSSDCSAARIAPATLVGSPVVRIIRFSRARGRAGVRRVGHRHRLLVGAVLPDVADHADDLHPLLGCPSSSGPNEKRVADRILSFGTRGAPSLR